MVERKYGNDGVAHLTFFDPGTQLSFTWDPSHDDDAIEVSAGGYGEPVVDEFDAFDFDDQWGDAPSLGAHLIKFEAICKAYLDRRSSPLTIEDALIEGFRAGVNGAVVGRKFDGSIGSPRSKAYEFGLRARRALVEQAGIE